MFLAQGTLTSLLELGLWEGRGGAERQRVERGVGDGYLAAKPVGFGVWVSVGAGGR